jgi:hypothetical protein
MFWAVEDEFEDIQGDPPPDELEDLDLDGLDDLEDDDGYDEAEDEDVEDLGDLGDLRASGSV